MFKTTVIKILKSCGKKELKHFHSFVHSPYFNKHEAVRELVDYLDDCYPNYTLANTDRAVIFRALYPNEVHDQAHLAILFTYTLRLLEDFLAHEALKCDESTKYLLLLKELRKREQGKHYEKKLKAAQLWLQDTPFQDHSFQQSRFLLTNEEVLYAEYDPEIARNQDTAIQEKEQFLDEFYIAEKLKDGCEMLVRQRIFKLEYEYDSQLLTAVQLEVTANPTRYVQVPAIIVYYKMYALLSEEVHIRYTQALETVAANAHFFKPNELRELYKYLQNYCIAQVNQGKELYVQYLFELYQSQLEQQLLLENSYLPEWHYKNIVTIGLRLQAKDWVKAFIEEYKPLLEADVAENAYSFNLATYYYHSKQYDAVLELMLRMEYSDIRYSLSAKVLLLRTYFDTGEDEALLSHLESFKQYVKRNRLITNARRIAFQNLIKLSRKAIKMRLKKAYEPTEKWQRQVCELREEINSTEPVVNKAWLLETVT